MIKLQRIDLLLINVPKEAAILFSVYTTVVQTAISTFGFEWKAKIIAYISFVADMEDTLYSAQLKRLHEEQDKALKETDEKINQW